MDAIDTFKLQALDNLSKTIDALQGEIDKSQSYVDRVRPGSDREGSVGSNEADGSLQLPADGTMPNAGSAGGPTAG